MSGSFNSNKDPTNNTLLKLSFIMIAIVLFILVAKKFSLQNLYSLFTAKKPTLVVSNPTPSPTPTPLAISLSTESKQWLLATSALLSYRNGESLNTLDCECTQQTAEMLLREWWGVADRASALSTLEWLKKEGHTKQFADVYRVISHFAQTDEEYIDKRESIIKFVNSDQDRTTLIYLLDFVWKNRNKLATKKLYAWDYMRMASVARWAYSARYISEKEAWSYMFFAGQNLQRLYGSWDELGNHYILGRTFWMANAYHPEMENALRWLSTNPESPWKRILWNTDLTK